MFAVGNVGPMISHHQVSQSVQLDSFKASSVINQASRNQLNGGSSEATEPSSHPRKRQSGHKRSKSQGMRKSINYVVQMSQMSKSINVMGGRQHIPQQSIPGSHLVTNVLSIAYISYRNRFNRILACSSPNMELFKTQGNQISLSSFSGQKHVLNTSRTETEQSLVPNNVKGRRNLSNQQHYTQLPIAMNSQAALNNHCKY